MSGVPYTFASATTSIPLSELDANFNTGLTLGTTTVGLGNTATTLQSVTVNGGTFTNVASNITFASGTNGIIFNNSSALTNSTLNDYETGTFTPTITPTSGSWTTSSTLGYYVKIGKIVNLTFYLTITTVGTGSGGFSITNFPFTAFNPGSISGGPRSGIGLVREDAVTGDVYQCFITASTTTGAVQSFTGGNVIQDSRYVYNFSLTYEANF